MNFTNLNLETFLIFLLIFSLWVFLSYLIFKSNKNKYSLFFILLSLFFILINIFEIKWKNIAWNNIKWWNLVFVLDLSKSMNVLDIASNSNYISRLDISKDSIKEYISLNINNFYWLIAFAWEALEILPFSSDYDIYSSFLNWLSSNNISKVWTNIDSVFSSLDLYFEWKKDWWLAVIFTDWWDEKLNLNENILSKLRDKNIKIIFVWVWTKKWWYIPDWIDFFWKQKYKIYNWEQIFSVINSDLKRFSDKYDFDYFEINNINDFNGLENIIDKNLDKVYINNDSYYNVDYTRFFIFISFVFFILFLVFDNKIWIRK